MLRRRWRAVSSALRELGLVFEYDDDFDRGSMSLLSVGELRDWMSNEESRLRRAAELLRAIAEPKMDEASPISTETVEDQPSPVASPPDSDEQEPL